MLLIILALLLSLLPGNLISSQPSGQNHPDKTLKIIGEKIYYYPRQAETMLDSLMNADSLKIKKDHSGELTFLQAFLSYHKGNSDKALDLLEAAMSTFILNESSGGQAKCYLLMGWITQGDS